MSKGRSPVVAGPLPYVLLAIARLTEAIERETMDLDRPETVDYRAHAQRKSQGLMELSRLTPALSQLRGHPGLRAALSDLLDKLDANQRLLNAKLRRAIGRHLQ